MSPYGQEPTENVLLRFSTKPEDNVTGYDDIALEYAVVACPTALGGVIVYGRYQSGWVANPSERHVIRHLLGEMKAEQAKSAALQEAFDYLSETAESAISILERSKKPGA